MSTTTAVARSATTPTTVLVHAVLGASLTAAAIAGAVEWSTGVWSVLLFAVLPDLAFLVGIGQPHTGGRLPRRTVPVYNLLHHPVVPALLLAVAATGLLDRYWVVAALAWGAHIAFDRACGYGLRGRDGWQRG